MRAFTRLGRETTRAAPAVQILLLATLAGRVRRQMASRAAHLRLLNPPAPARTAGWRTHGYPLDPATANGACHAVYGTAEPRYRRLVAREMARLRLRTPEIGGAPLCALHDKLARLDPPITTSGPRAMSGWSAEECELNRLDAFLAELRAAAAAPGAPS